jgi:hypothetical protein
MHISASFLHIHSILLHISAARILHPRPTPAIKSRSSQHPWHDHACSTLESLLGEQWNVIVTFIQHMQNKMVRNNKLQTIDSKQSGTRTNRAARTIDDFINGREGATIYDFTDGHPIGSETMSGNK